MMKGSLRLSRCAIGLDFGSTDVRAVQLDHRRNLGKVLCAAEFPRFQPGQPITSDEVAQIADVLWRQGFRGKSVTLSMPGDSLLSGIMDVPPEGSGAPRNDIVKMELARMSGCDSKEMEMDHWALPPTATGHNAQQAMAVGYAHTTSAEFIETVEQGGLVVEALDANVCALSRACRPALDEPNGICVLLEIGFNGTKLAIIHQSVAVYLRYITNVSLGLIIKSLQKDFNLDRVTLRALLSRVNLSISNPTNRRESDLVQLESRIAHHFDKLVHELIIPLEYVCNSYQKENIATVVLAGSAGEIKGLSDHLAKKLETKVVAPSLDSLVQCPADMQGRFGPSMITALGLARFVEA